jgi:hypothetical protein
MKATTYIICNAVLGAAITIPEPEAKPPQPTVTASPV